MSRLDEFHAAGYAVVPARGGHPIAGGMFAGRYHYTPGSEQFADFDVGLVCAGMPIPSATGRGPNQEIVLNRASGAGSLGAIASTWIAAISWTSHNIGVSKEIDAIVSKALGYSGGPAFHDGNTTIRLARVDTPIRTRKMQPQHFAAEKFRSFDYVPHRFEIVSGGAWIVLPPGAKPTPRADLPLVDDSAAEQILTAVETVFRNRSSQPWI